MMSDYTSVPCFTYDAEEHATTLKEARSIAASQAASESPSFFSKVMSLFSSSSEQNPVDRLGQWGSTPLIAACTEGNGALVEELLSLGADPLLAAYGETRYWEDIKRGVGEEKATVSSLGEEGLLAAYGVATAAYKEADAVHTKAAAMQTSGEDVEKYLAEIAAKLESVHAISEDLRTLEGYTTPLGAAARGGHADIVRMLIAHVDSTQSKAQLKEEINATHFGDGETALYNACIMGHASVAEALMETGLADPNKIGVSSMHTRGVSGDLECVVSHAPLTAACDARHVDIVQMLLNDPRTDVNMLMQKPCMPGIKVSLSESSRQHVYKNSIKHTALGRSCRDLKHDLKQVYEHDSDKLQCTASIDGVKKRLRIIKLLLAHPKIDVNVANETGETPLSIACRYRGWGSVYGLGDTMNQEYEAITVEVVSLLLAANADINEVSKCKDGYYGSTYYAGARGEWPLLHHACCTANILVAKFLLENGADPNGHTHEHPESGMLGVTPLLVLLTNGDYGDEGEECDCGHQTETFNLPQVPELIQILLDYGANPHTFGTDCASGINVDPLNVACQSAEAALVLLNHESQYDINKKCQVTNRHSGGAYGLDEGQDAIFFNDYAPLHILGQSKTHWEGYTSRAPFSALREYKYGSQVELLLKLLSHNGSTGAVDVNQRNGANEHPLQLMAFGDTDVTDVYNPFLAVMLVNSKELEVDARVAMEGVGTTILLQKCKHIYDDIDIADVKLLITFGASLTHREIFLLDMSPGKNAAELVAESAGKLVPVYDRWGQIKPPGIQNLSAIALSKWFEVTAEWSAIEVGASCRFHIEISAAVQRGVMNLDNFELCELKSALAIAKTDPKGKPGWVDAAIPPVCEATVKLMHAAASSWRKGWIPAGHWLFHSGVRTAVQTVVSVSVRLQRKGEGNVAVADDEEIKEGDDNITAVLPLLPPEIWHYIMSFFQREDWVVPPLNAEWGLRLLNSRCANNK